MRFADVQVISEVKCRGSIVREELEVDGEKHIMLRCNACGAVIGPVNAAIAEALVMKLLDEVVIHRFDEEDDDWAWRKGQQYGTILVDLERPCVVDLLPERSAESLAEWLANNPSVSVISRDRSGLYAEGAASGAPDAQQVADRFHLIVNLSGAIERALEERSRLLVLPGAGSTG